MVCSSVIVVIRSGFGGPTIAPRPPTKSSMSPISYVAYRSGGKSRDSFSSSADRASHNRSVSLIVGMRRLTPGAAVPNETAGSACSTVVVSSLEFSVLPNRSPCVKMMVSSSELAVLLGLSRSIRVPS
eukprot:scaffold1678_cov110-Isochrysis_galbana.AAC.17